jgi:hypothetical protein
MAGTVSSLAWGVRTEVPAADLAIPPARGDLSEGSCGTQRPLRVPVRAVFSLSSNLWSEQSNGLWRRSALAIG